MKLVRPSVFLATLFLLPTVAVLAQAAPAADQAAPAPDEDPMPPSIPSLAGPRRTGPPAYTEGPDATVSTVNPSRSPAARANPDDFLPSLVGPIGLYHLSTAEVGPENHLRLALHGEFFKTTDFLVKPIGAPDQDTRLNGSFSFGYTPHRNVEIFGAFLTSSNRNVRTDPPDMPARRDPELIKSFGDLVLGSKAALPVARGMTVAFELGLRFLSSISDLSFSPSSTSLWIGPLYMLDLRPINDTPLRFHASASYYLDQSKNLINFNDPAMGPISSFTREVATFAYGIQESRFRLAAGADWNLEKIAPTVPMRVFGEYHAEIVTGSAEAAFAGQPADTHSRVQSWVTVGLRARVFHGLTLDAGTDFRLSSVGYQYGPPLPPYNIVFGVSYPLDIDAFTQPVVVTRTVEHNGPVAAPVLEGQVVGTVKSAKDGQPVPAALVAVAKRPLSRVATDPDGSFQTVPLPPGPAQLEISAPGFESTKVTTAVILGHPSRADVTLTPKLLTGNVRGKVTDGKGRALQAALRIAGAEVFSAQADSSGQFSAALPVGAYRVTAEMPQMPPKEVPLEIVEGQDRQLDIVMSSPNPNVTLTGDAITLKQPISFKPGPPRLDAKIQAELDGVAELLAEHPEVRTVRIEAYWDSSAGKNAQTLTNKQALAVKAYLVKKGVSDGRLEAVGKGADQPLVPNIGPVNKAKNRRVELHVGS